MFIGNFKFLELLLISSTASILASPLLYPKSSSEQVIYVSANDATDNYIVALEVSHSNGMLSSPVRTRTGGKGEVDLVAISQDSVTVSGDLLFVVNPGSNTLSMFTINPADPLHPILVGTPASTLGNRPVSVAYSPQLEMACVANGGLISGVACFSVDRHRGLKAAGPLRLIPQTEVTDPTAPPPGPLVLASDIVFNPSSSAVFVAVRSNGGQPGLLYAWPIIHGEVSLTPVTSPVPTLSLLFSFRFIDSDSKLLATNPHQNSPGLALLDVSRDLKVAQETSITLPEQVASCWVALAPQFDTAFIIDAGSSNISAVNPKTGALKDTFHSNAAGGEDSLVHGNWLYYLTVANFTVPQILVFDIQNVNEGKLPQVQSFDLSAALGANRYWQGLSFYPSA
ncbi:hypothetical protein LTR56_017903 [Elasticomyces elasticus]|nr:hypothetical protein LTR56_017903 [Elasticomyces elasticus]KAK3637154.1 hypothetical protein LTR22_018410 [Elasticomyces elasticus]KAK5733788.1 hypothetical protein LTS12_026868 [Elasticomyces elasticus]